MTGEAADAVVVGAGVIGLTTGICLAEADSKCESELLSFQGTPRRPRRWQWSVLPSVHPGTLHRPGIEPPPVGRPGSDTTRTATASRSEEWQLWMTGTSNRTRFSQRRFFAAASRSNLESPAPGSSDTG